MPKFGRDLAYHPSSCDLYVVGAGCDIHRLNLEQGRFLNPLTTQALGVNVCKVNQDHHLFTCGTTGNNVLKYLSAFTNLKCSCMDMKSTS